MISLSVLLQKIKGFRKRQSGGTITKETDSFYLQKRNIFKEYDPVGAYDFEHWRQKFDHNIRERYESLHEDLLYTFEKQNFDDAISTFEKINEIFSGLGE